MEMHATFLISTPTAETRYIAFADLVRAVKYLSTLSPTDAAALMGTEDGPRVAKVELATASGAPAPSGLRSWDSVGRASPKALTDTEYDRFLNGEHPKGS
jgi:hypothetical protein